MGSSKNKVRGRVDYIHRFTYKAFLKKYPDTPVTYNQFVEILKLSNNVIGEYIIENPLGFKLPYNMGYLAVDKFRPGKKHFSMDWAATRKFGKPIPNLNLHSFGYVFKVKLYKNNRLKPFLLHKMDAHRFLKRRIAQKIKSGKYEYISIDKSYYNRRFQIDKITKID